MATIRTDIWEKIFFIMAYRSNIDDHSSILDNLLRYIGPGGQFNGSLCYNVFFAGWFRK